MSAITSLSSNSIKQVCESENIATDLRDTYIIVQIIDVKIFNTTEQKKNVKSRITLSDGTSSVIAMITDKLDKLMDGKDFDRFTILRINAGGIQINAVNGRKVLILRHPPEVIFTGLKRVIGSPLDYDTNLKQNSFITSYDIRIPLPETDQKKPYTFSQDSLESDFNHMGIISPINSREEQKRPVQHQERNNLQQTRISGGTSMIQQQQNQSKTRYSSVQDLYTPIRVLNQFATDWKIRVRITKKHDKREWKNERGQGLIMNIDLIDSESTQIQATFFNDAVTKFDDILREGKVYLMANGIIKLANKKFTSIKNDYCITFDTNAEIKDAPEDNNIKTQGFSFVSINEIQNLMQGNTLDVIGVVTEVGQPGTLALKSGESREKRTIMIADEGGVSISATFWGQMNNVPEIGQVVAIKCAKVSEYNGKTLNCGEGQTTLNIEPNHRRTNELARWYSQKGDKTIQSLSTGGGGGGNRDDFRLIPEIINQLNSDTGFLGGQTASQFFKISGYVQRVFFEEQRPMFYMACPECKKKLQEEGNIFRCENCNKMVQFGKPSFNFSAKVGDLGESIIVGLVGEQGDSIMQMTAAEFKRIRDQGNNEQLRELVNNLNFSQQTIVVKTSLNNYTGQITEENRFKYSVSRVFPYNVKEENQMLLRRLDMYSKQ